MKKEKKDCRKTLYSCDETKKGEMEKKYYSYEYGGSGRKKLNKERKKLNIRNRRQGPDWWDAFSGFIRSLETEGS